MSLARVSNTNHTPSRPTSRETTESPNDTKWEKIANYTQEHYDVIKPLQFRDMALSDILKRKPVILLGESHAVEKTRKYHGWLINQLYHDKAILLIEHSPSVDRTQLEFVDRKIVKKIKCWKSEGDTEKSELLGLVAEHLYLQLNAIKDVIASIKGLGLESSSHIDFDEKLNTHIDAFPEEIEYQELQNFFYFKEPGEGYDAFWKIMINLIDKLPEYLDPFVVESMEQNNQLFWKSLKSELFSGFQPLVISGKEHIKLDALVVQKLLKKDIPFISCFPKLTKFNCNKLKETKSETPSEGHKKSLRQKNSQSIDSQQQTQTLAVTDPTPAPLLDILEKSIIAAEQTSFDSTGPMSIYKLPHVLKKYCKLKLAEGGTA